MGESKPRFRAAENSKTISVTLGSKHREMEQARADFSTRIESRIPGTSPNSTVPEMPTCSAIENSTKSKPPLSQTEIFKAIEVVEKDSLAIAESFTSLFASLRLALSEASGNSIDHMHCFSDAAGRLQESVLDAATKGNRYINSSLRLNQEMKGIDNLAAQLKVLRKNADALDLAVNKLLDFP